MKRVELKSTLDQDGIMADAYSLHGGLPNEAYCLAEVEGVWEVYYSERGNKTGMKKFGKEEEACEHFYALIQKNR